MSISAKTESGDQDPPGYNYASTEWLPYSANTSIVAAESEVAGRDFANVFIAFVPSA